MAANNLYRIQSMPDTSAAQKLTEDPSAANKAAECTVACVYETKLFEVTRRIMITWSKNLINVSLNIAVHNPGNENECTCKIDFKPWPFWSKKGFKSFELDEKRVYVYWDLRSAKFTGSPEPSEDYYVALKENIFGKKCFSTRAKFDQNSRKEHDIVMWISIDGIVVIHVTNLQWKFRGNEIVIVNKSPVQVYWDVHNWLFGNPSGHGMFIFRPGTLEYSAGGSETGDGSSAGGTDTYVSADSRPTTTPDFSLFIYA
ncbi:hypothetical protein MKW98_022217 [Papaver atlanticum]|uniref:Uncharacterized protein n=1 Tax=Papaver atlanticum TaxID=357466 RepID=A0AAD4T5Q0_9MAGN|nr:hypothetical protein MKW98_022217 [Papaver atlanticum]